MGFSGKAPSSRSSGIPLPGIDELLLGGGFVSSLFGGESEEEKQMKIDNRVSNAEYEARLPLRALAINRLTGPQPQRENLNRLFEADLGNPYSQSMERPAVLPGGAGGMAGGGGILNEPRIPVTGMGDTYANTIRPELPGTHKREALAGIVDKYQGRVTEGKGIYGGLLTAAKREQQRRGY
jgi:hypothetical protein